jgi:hypothetical protein
MLRLRSSLPLLASFVSLVAAPRPALAGDVARTADTASRALLAARTKTAATLVTSGLDRFGDGDTVVRYEQSYRGLPVIGRGAAVRLSRLGKPLATETALETDLPTVTIPTVAPAAAAAIAARRLAVGAGAADAHLVVWPTLDRGARLAYAVLPRVPAMFGKAPRAIVDAATGEVLEARDTVVFARATMYELNPTKTPTPTTVELALTPVGKSLTNPFLESKNCIDNKTVKPVDMFGFNLRVHVCDLVNVAVATDAGDFTYEPADVAGSANARTDAFSEVSIYYHAAKAYALFRELQGDAEAQVVVDKPLRVVANLQVPAGITSGNISAAANPDTPLETFQNAFFSPSGGGLGALFQQLYGFDAGALWFGQGPKRDYAYDGDVVYHEFAHAVVDATLKLGAWHVDARGAIDAPGAMNEALADYFSSAITGDPDVGEYAATDLGAGADVIRRLDNRDRCPTAIVGEVHFDSTVFSGALWDARKAIAPADQRRFDAAIYKAMRTNPGRGDVGFDDVAKLFLATLGTDLPAGATALSKALDARGLLDGCDRTRDFDGAPIASPLKALGFAAPGRQTVSLRGLAPGVIQIRAAMPKGTGSIQVSFSARSGSGGPTATNPLGGDGDPFTPVVLAKMGAPITWDAKTKTGHDADVVVAVEGTGKVSATLRVPEGTTADTVYLQIANKGDSDGAYDAVAVAFSPSDGDPASGEPPAGDDAPAAGPTTRVVEKGCTTSPGERSTALLAPVLVAAAALLRARRRR